jgi:hypothetical protein
MTAAKIPSRILVNINGNVPEWRACLGSTGVEPRLPLPFAFGAGLLSRGISLVAFDTSGKPPPADFSPFKSYFCADQFKAARAAADFLVLWGTSGIRSCLSDAAFGYGRPRTVLLAYGWRPFGHVALSRRVALALTRQTARFARSVVVMTRQQALAARADLPNNVNVVRLRVGIDTKYYSHASSLEDVPEQHREAVEMLLQEPYVILPGDELRLNDDALSVIRATGIRLVRIFQYGHKSGTNGFKQEVSRRGMDERVFVFERISYAFLRFLLQHANAYAGFVDASWQPAGWTVACESLASGLPLVLYDGLTARELSDQGLPCELMRVVSIGDLAGFGRELCSVASAPRSATMAMSAQRFAASELDVELTAPDFANELAAALDTTR